MFLYIEHLGELYEAVQEQKIFSDSKYFVDCIPRKDVNTILEEYKRSCWLPGFDLSLFVEQHFIMPPPLVSDYLSGNKPLLKHIEDLWIVLKRNPVDVKNSTLIPLPFPYIVPGGRFREVFYWDSYFTMLGLQVTGYPELIEAMVNNFAYLIDRFGFIPNGNRTYFTTRSQPPFFSLMIDLLAEVMGEEDIYTRYLPQLEKEYQFWMNQRAVILPDGHVLNRYYDQKDTVRPEAYYEETKLANRSGRPVNEVHQHLRAACESGWDYSSRWLQDGQHWETIEAANYIPVDLNCLLLHLEEVLLRIYTSLNDLPKINVLKDALAKRVSAIEQYCWNGTFYVDYHFVDQQQSDKLSLAAVYPLFFKIANADQASKVAQLLEEKFLCAGGLVTTTVNTGQQWDAPNGWAPLQWMAYKGLLNYGFTQLAARVKNRWLITCEKVYANTGKMMEKYDVIDVANKAAGGKYPNQDGFGWTNGVYLKLLHS